MRLRSIGFIVALALGLLMVPLAAGTQQPGKVYLVGLSQTDRDQCPPAHDGPGQGEDVP